MLEKAGSRWGVTPVSPRLDDLVRQWERALARQELSPYTVRTYDWALQNFLQFLADRQVEQCDQLAREQIEDWQDSLFARLGRRSRSMASVAVRQFLRFGVGRNLVDPHAPYWVTRVKGVRGRPRPIPGD